MKFRCKKFISLVLTLIMLMSVVSATFGVLGAEEKILVDSGQCGADVYWYYYDDESLEFSGTGNMYDFAGVPSPWPESVTSVEIKDGITNIGAYAFSSALEKIVIADSVTTIGEGAFWGCDKLKELVFPANVDLIDHFAFNSCSGLEVITFNGTDVTVGAEAFENTALTDIYFGGTVEQWNNGVLSNVSYPNDKFFSATVHCTDGETTGGGNQGGDDFGDDGFEEIPEQICFGTIGLDETLTLDFNESNTVWRLEFTPDETGYYAFSASSYGSDTYGTVYNSQMESLASNDDYNGFDFRVVCEFEAGNTYYLEAKYLYAHETGSFDVCVEYVDDKVTDGNIPDDDGSEDYPDQITHNGTIGLDETLTLDFDEANTRWLLEFAPEETGIYSFYSVSDSDTYGMLYDSYMDWLTDDDDGGIDCNFKITYELQAGETYYWAAKYLGDYETGSFDVTLVKSSYCDYYGHSFTNYVYNNDATQTVDGTKTARCDNGCGETDTVTAYGTATNPTIIDIYPGETKTATIMPDEKVIFRAHSAEDFENTEYWYYLSDEYDSFFYVYWYDSETKEDVDGGMGDEYFSFVNSKDRIYDISVGAVDSIETTVTLYMHPHTHSYEFDRTHLPNCYEDGYDIYRCECGKEKYDNYVPTDGQCNYEIIEVKEPTCADGYTYYECRGCGDGYKDDIVPADKEHGFMVYEVQKNSCGYSGYTVYICVNCRAEKIADEVPATGNHEYIYRSDNNVTCSSYGTKTGICRVCNDIITVTDDAGLSDHRYSNYIYDDNGTKTGTCIFYCGATDTIPGSVSGHNEYDYYICNSEVTITRYLGSDTDITVPSTLEGYPVTIIGRGAFNGLEVNCIILPEGVTTIEEQAFYYCGITEVTLPSTLKTIGFEAFSHCENLRGDLVIPEGVTEIGSGAFSNCGFDGELTLPSTLKTIEKSAFSYCRNFTGSLVIPEGITEIGINAFGACGFDGTLTLPSTLKIVGGAAFEGCENLNGDLIIPEVITEIAGTAFASCGFDGELVLPESLRKIGIGAFDSCYYFKGELILPDSITEIGENAFFECNFSGDLVLPKNLTVIEDCAFEGCENLESITIPMGVTRVGNYAFDRCGNLKGKLTIPDSVIGIGVCAFRDSYFDRYYIGKNVEYIGWDAFNYLYPCHVGFSGTESEWISMLKGSVINSKYLHLNYDPETAIITERIEPTCDEEGKEIVKCSCGYVISEEYIDPIEHSFTNYVSDNNSTVIGHGTKTAYCDYGCGARDTIPEADIESIEVVGLPTKTDYIFEIEGEWQEFYYYDKETDEEYSKDIFCYELATDGMEIKVNFIDGVSEVFEDWELNDIRISGQKSEEVWNIGSHEVTVEWFGKKAAFNVNVIENPVESIEVYTLPYKTEYIYEVNGRWEERYDGEKEDNVPYFEYNIDIRGMKIKVNYKDGTSKVFDCYNLDGDDTYGQKSQTWDIGTHEMTVEYCNKTATFDIEIVENDISSIEIASQPDKTEYIYENDGGWYEIWDYDEDAEEEIFKGEYYLYSIDKDGLSIKVNYKDGTAETVRYWDLVDAEIITQRKSDGKAPEVWGIGTHTATVKYGSFTADFNIEVIEKNPVQKVELVHLPEKEYLRGEYMDLRGAKFRITHSDGTEEIVEITYDNYYDKKYGTYSFDMGYINGKSFFIGPYPEKNTATSRCFEFEYTGHRIEINVPLSGLKVVSTEIISEPEGTLSGAKVKLTLSDSSVIETTILHEDYRAGDAPDTYKVFLGYISTEYGIFQGIKKYCYLYEPEKTVLEYVNLGTSENTQNYTEFYDYFNAERTVEMNRYIENYNKFAKLDNSDNVDFFGEITADNIDQILYTATSLVGYKQDHFYLEYTAEAAKNAVKDLFGCDEIDLTLSKYYNEETGIYKAPNIEDFTVYRNRSYTTEQTPAGIGVIEKITDDYTEETYYLYVIFNEESKVVYLSNEKWSFLEEDEDDIFIDESTGVEIEHPSQPDIDFDVEKIEGDAFVLVEKTITNNLGDNWELLKAFDITMKNHDGVHVQPDGTVKVKLPLDWEKDGNYKVYRVNDDGSLTDMNAYRQGSHMVFETDHFSIYVIVEEGEKTPEKPTEPENPDVPDEPENPSVNCSCKCHKNGFMGFIWKILCFFYRIFGMNKICSCGVAHY